MAMRKLGGLSHMGKYEKDSVRNGGDPQKMIASRAKALAAVSLEPLPATSTFELPCVQHLFEESQPDARYVRDMVVYLRELEERRQLSANFLSKADSPVAPSMRAVLVDWLIAVQHYLALSQETLYTTVQIMDHFFDSGSSISMSTLQLLVVSALFIACKMEEQIAPKMKKLLHMTEDAYTVKDLLTMERYVFSKIEFNASFATPVQFISLYLRALNSDDKHSRIVSFYLLDVVLHDVNAARVPSSLMAAAAAYLASRILMVGADGPDRRRGSKRIIRTHSGYTEDDLRPVISLIVNTLLNIFNSDYQGAYNKYSSVSRYNAVSKSEKLLPEAISALVFI